MAEALSWLWRLGTVEGGPDRARIAFGALDEAAELAAAVAAGNALGAVIFAPEAGASVGVVPARRSAAGVARFAPGARVYDTHAVFDSGTAVVSTRLGSHAVLAADRVLAVGADLAGRWGRLGAYWALAPIEEFLVETLDRPLLKLPPLGCVRIDDSPGTAQQQLEGRAKDDREASKRLRELRRTYGGAGTPISVAVAGRGLADGEPVPAEEVWPEAIAELRAGVEAGVFEPVVHGLLHYDPAATTAERVEPREFLELDQDEAGRRIDAAVAWQRETIGEPQTFVAPAWGYSEGAIAALRDRSLPAWHRAAAEPLLVDGNPRETLIGAGGPGGVFRLDYGSLARLAAAGLPPTPVFHGKLLDDRVLARSPRDLPGWPRLVAKRDILRMPGVNGVSWIGGGELVERLRGHDASTVAGTEARLAAGHQAILRDRSGARMVSG